MKNEKFQTSETAEELVYSRYFDSDDPSLFLQNVSAESIAADNEITDEDFINDIEAVLESMKDPDFLDNYIEKNGVDARNEITTDELEPETGHYFAGYATGKVFYFNALFNYCVVDADSDRFCRVFQSHDEALKYITDLVYDLSVPTELPKINFQYRYQVLKELYEAMNNSVNDTVNKMKLPEYIEYVQKEDPNFFSEIFEEELSASFDINKSPYHFAEYIKFIEYIKNQD